MHLKALFLQILSKIRLNLLRCFLLQLQSVRDSVKVTNLTHYMESSMPKAVTAGLLSEPTVPNQQPLFPTHGIPKIIVSGNVTTRDLISLLRSLLNLNGLKGQLVDNVKRQLLWLQGEKTEEEILKPLQFRCLTTPHIGVKIMVSHRKYLGFR
ncbi:hypothetical protein ACTXT7_009585 [Hymenolepis weldensis]